MSYIQYFALVENANKLNAYQTRLWTNTYSLFVLWVILLILIHAGNLQFLAIFHKLAANEQWLLPKTSKIW